MDREASFLRCSKLNCYSEFNRMVQALTVHGRRDSHSNLRPPNKGTGTEYNFYQTLSIMLQQVLSNPSSNGQRSELKMMYQWFTLNKPLTPQRVKPSAPRPKLVLSTKRTIFLSNRPQTAPAALGGRYSSCKTPVCPPSTPALTSFASTYIARTMNTQELPVMRPASQPLPVRNDWLIDGENDQSLRKPTSSTIGQTTSNHFNHDLLSLSGMTSRTIAANATSVAAQMTLDRFMSNMDRSSVIPKNLSNNAMMPQTVTQVKQEKSLQRQRSPSVERSKSLTTLETISEVDNEYIVDSMIDKSNIVPTTKHVADSEKDHEYNTSTAKNGMKPQQYNTKGQSQEIMELQTEEMEKDSEILVQIPKVTIKDKSCTKAKLNRHSATQKPLSAGEPARKACQIQVISLNLQSVIMPRSNNRSASHHNQTRKPKKLVPIVAGFNQQQYRPRTVA